MVVSHKVHETKTAALSSFGISTDGGRCNLAELSKHVAELFIRDLRVDIFNVDICEICLHFLELALTILLRDMVSNKHFLIIEQHSIDVLNSVVGRFSGFVVNETVTLRVTVLILSNFATKNVPKSSK